MALLKAFKLQKTLPYKRKLIRQKVYYKGQIIGAIGWLSWLSGQTLDFGLAHDLRVVGLSSPRAPCSAGSLHKILSPAPLHPYLCMACTLFLSQINQSFLKRTN